MIQHILDALHSGKDDEIAAAVHQQERYDADDVVELLTALRHPKKTPPTQSNAKHEGAKAV